MPRFPALDRDASTGMPPTTRTVPLLCFLLALAGCAAPPEPPLEAPGVETHVRYYAGDPIQGPLGTDGALALAPSVEQAIPVRGRLYVVSELPGDRYAPLTDHVRLIVAEGEGEPISARSLLTPGARLAVGGTAAELARSTAARPPSEMARTATFEGLVLPGITLVMSAANEDPLELDGLRPADRTIEIELWREDPEAERISIALVFTGLVESVEGLALAQPAVSLQRWRERIVLDAHVSGPVGPVTLFAPARLGRSSNLSYVLVLEAERAGDGEGLDEEVERIRLAVVESATEGAELRRRLAREDELRMRRLRSLEALADAAHRRAALVELAGVAPIAPDLVLLADDPLLELLCTSLLDDAQALEGLAGDADALAWSVERTAVGLLVRQAMEGGLPPEHEALLLRHVGEAGRFVGAVEDALAASSSLAEFSARMLEENRIALEDSSPAARVRAHDWLLANGHEVPGYDPLATRSDRRAALEAWAAAEAEQP